MTSLPDTFFRMASAKLSDYPSIKTRWSGPERDGKRILLIPKADDRGFDVTIECETYGLYPFANGWHGAPWDAPHDSKTTAEEICEDCLGFLRSVLCPDATLTVWYTAGKPYKWILSYPWGDTRLNDETGSLFYNYLGRRESRMFHNRHLPSRDEPLQPNNPVAGRRGASAARLNRNVRSR